MVEKATTAAAHHAQPQTKSAISAHGLAILPLNVEQTLNDREPMTSMMQLNVNAATYVWWRKPKSYCFKIQRDHEDDLMKCRVGEREHSLVIDSGSRTNLISPKDWSFLQRNKATTFNVRPNSTNQFRGYASHELLQVICVFEAPISVD